MGWDDKKRRSLEMCILPTGSTDAPNTLQVSSTASVITGTGSNNSDAEAVKASGLAEAETYARVFNGTTWDRQYGSALGTWVQGPVAAASAHGTEKPVQVGISDGTNVRRVLGDSSGRVFTNVAQINAVTPLMGNGVTGTGSLRVTLATDNSALTTAGLFSVKFDQTTVGTTNMVVPGPGTLIGNSCLASAQASLATPNIKASAGNVYGLSVVNKDAAILYIQFYNTAGTPTRGTSVVWWIPVGPSQTVHFPPGAVAMANHATGIAITAATAPTGSVAPTTAPDVVVYYK